MGRLRGSLCCVVLTLLVSLEPASAASFRRTVPADYAAIHIAFTGNDGNVYLMDANGGHRTRLTSHASASTVYDWYAWSPDHRYLLMRRYSGTATDILVLRADGSLLATVAAGVPYGPFVPMWARDGDAIAYVAAEPVPTGSNSTTTTVTVNSVTLNGTKTLLWRYRTQDGCGAGGGSTAAQLYQNELDGFVTHALQWSMAGHDAIYPGGSCNPGLSVIDWKSGKSEAFPSTVNEVVQAPSAPLLALSSSGQASAAQSITVYRNNARILSVAGMFPAWSPDSRFLYLERCKAGPACAIFKVEVARSDVTQLIPWQQHVYAFGPLHVTPDGRAVICSRIDIIDSQRAQVSIQRSDNSGVTILARDAARPAL